LNYAEVTGFVRNGSGRIRGAMIRDTERRDEHTVEAKAIINATGPFCDHIRKLSDPTASEMVAPSQGIHLVVDKSFLGGSTAIVVPRTTDGRVMFAIPWQGQTVLGTTDTPISSTSEEPVALPVEVTFVLENAARYLSRAPKRTDVLSVFAGIRPLIKSSGSSATQALSRDHKIHSDSSGLITITGGKWTTYRNMAELCVDYAAKGAGLPDRPCVTRSLPLHGSTTTLSKSRMRRYGSDADEVEALAHADNRLSQKLHADLPYTGAEVAWACRSEMAITLEDVLSRRLRALFLNAGAAIEIAPDVARIMSVELGWNGARIDSELKQFNQVATLYKLGS
jgi:glycerol-3-phosphate dehydrogenase